jgi:predicted GNAT family N-acyltransferase
MEKNVEHFRFCTLDSNKKNEVIKLTTSVFGISRLPEIDYHYELTVNGKLCGYCAISIRKVIIENVEIKVNLLGVFCITENYRKKGFGTNFLEYIKKDIYTVNDYGIILNCGFNIEEYYYRNGFIRISDQAKYYRNNRIQTDKDPVLYFGTKVFAENCESMFIGTDF